MHDAGTVQRTSQFKAKKIIQEAFFSIENKNAFLIIFRTGTTSIGTLQNITIINFIKLIRNDSKNISMIN